jgi:hypothetical protein
MRVTLGQSNTSLCRVPRISMPDGLRGTLANMQS